MNDRRSLQRFLPLLVLICSLSAVYLSTLAPGLTWANDGSDGGDLITAAATSGVPHPTGYPLYMLLARAFQLLPVGSLAFRTNLLSAAATVLGAGLVYMLVRDASALQRKEGHWAAALAAGCAFGLAPVVWSQAVITEVYGLQALLVALLFYLYASPASKGRDCWRGLILGLAMTNHLTAIFLVPAALLPGSIRRSPPEGITKPGRRWHEKLEVDRAALVRQVGTFGLGLSLYLILPLRAAANPPVNWGNVITPGRFWWLVSGQFYQGYSLPFSLADSWGRLQSAAALLLEQFGLPGVALGLTGLVLYWRPSRLYLLTLWTALVFTAFAILYGSADSYVYLLPGFLSFAVWIGLGVSGLSDQCTRCPPVLRILLAVLLVGYFAGRSIPHASQVDASSDVRAETFGEEVFSTVPENAILFARGDRAVFALWYFHFALGERPDTAVLAVDLLHFDWYQEGLRSTYPSLVLPAPSPWTEMIIQSNPSRPACDVSYSDSAQIDCPGPVQPPGEGNQP